MHIQRLPVIVGLSVVGAGAVALARATLVVVTVVGQSMTPALQTGDRVLVLRYWPSGRLRIGHIVLVWPWGMAPSGPKPFSETPYIKRIIGLPGDTLVTSLVELNDFHRRRESAAHDSNGQRVWHIPPGHVFVRGDNPLRGFDSLSWGPIPFRGVLGIVIKTLPRKVGSGPCHASADEHPLRMSGPPVGQSAPDFTAETLDGARVTRADYAGRSVALLLIAPHCEPCREALPRYEALAPHAARAGVELVLVSIDTATPTRAFAAEQGIRLPLLVAPHDENPLMRDYNFTGTPSYCLLDAQGTIRAAGYPSFDWGEWQALAREWEAGAAPQTATPA